MNLKERQLALNNKTLFISCVVPVFNEEIIIDAFISKLQLALNEITPRFEIIVVDDGSRDSTATKLLTLSKNGSIKFLGLSRNFGKEIALTAGLEHSNGDVAILLDADFQHPIEMILCIFRPMGERL